MFCLHYALRRQKPEESTRSPGTRDCMNHYVGSGNQTRSESKLRSSGPAARALPQGAISIITYLWILKKMFLFSNQTVQVNKIVQLGNNIKSSLTAGISAVGHPRKVNVLET